ncbi:SAM-dependent methyltransferase [Nonomuraea sp. NPDC001684]
MDTGTSTKSLTLYDRPSIARVYNAATGGKDNHGDDRDVLLAVRRIAPRIAQAALANLEFGIRATRAVSELGISQWLNLGCGLPPDGYATTYQTVAEHHPDPSVVYVDIDPMVGSHGRALLDVASGTGMIEADARDVDDVLSHPEMKRLDRDRPVGIIATALTHFWSDADDPAGVLRRYMAAFPGGYVLLSHICHDLLTRREADKLVAAYRLAADVHMRSRAAITSMFLDGLEVLPPGLVEASAWRPDTAVKVDVGRAQFVAAVARFGHADCLEAA